MVLKLYYHEMSAPVRSTLLTIHALELQNQVDFVKIDILAGDQLKPEYVKKNPLHTIPTLEDDDFILFDSHAINIYLAEKYGKNDSLYPADIRKRAIVNQRIFFEDSVLFSTLPKIILPILRSETKTVAKEPAEAQIKNYQSLEKLIGDNDYVASNQLTIADFIIASTISTSALVVPIDDFPKVKQWLSRIQALPYYQQANQDGLDKLSQAVKNKLS